MFDLIGRSGNSNDGNTARIAFSNPEVFARILSDDEDVIELVEILADLINAVNTTLPLDPDAFDALCQRFLDIFHSSSVKWNVLSPSVHLLLIHGADLIRHFRGPIGVYSEEGPEANNKTIRYLKEPIIDCSKPFSSDLEFLTLSTFFLISLSD